MANKYWHQKGYVYGEPGPGREPLYIDNGEGTKYFQGYYDVVALENAERQSAEARARREEKRRAAEELRRSDLQIQARAWIVYREVLSRLQETGTTWREAHRLAQAEADNVRRELQRARRAEKKKTE